MKNFITIMLLSIISFAIASCSKSDDNESGTPKRTVLIYMCADNNLDIGRNSYFAKDSAEIVQGAASLPSNVNLIVYADRKNNYPFIAKVDKNGFTNIKTYTETFYSTDKDKMLEIINWVFTKYPASSYGLTFWGHGNGWIIEPTIYSSDAAAKARRKAYGIDFSIDNTSVSDGNWKYINIPNLADVLSNVPHLDYVFFDCCQMQCAEIAYELRNVCDYIIASPTEIPGDGAPYDVVVPALFSDKKSVGKEIVDNYIAGSSLSNYGGLPLSVVKTSKMDDLATVTSSAIDTIMTHYLYPNNVPVYDLIYYGINGETASMPCYYDIRNFMHKYLSDTDFDTWDAVFQQTVIYSIHPDDISVTNKEDWMSSELSKSNFRQFTINDDNYGGMSMFIPQTYYSSAVVYYLNPNVSIKSLKWNSIIDWTKWGWE